MRIVTTLREQTDEQLMQHLQRGEMAALQVLFERYYTPLKAYFHRMLWRDAAQAEDATQQLFLQVAQYAHSYQWGRPVRTWLYSAAHNICKNAYRQAGRTTVVPFAEETGDTAAHLPLPDAALHHHEFQQALATALDELAEDIRATFVLRYLEDMPLAEIAEVLNVPLGTVKSRLHNTLRWLANRLQMFHPHFAENR